MSADKGESDSFMAPIVALTDENRALKARLAEAEALLRRWVQRERGHVIWGLIEETEAWL